MAGDSTSECVREVDSEGSGLMNELIHEQYDSAVISRQ